VENSVSTSATTLKTWLGFMNMGQRSFQHRDLAAAVVAFGSATSLVPGRVEGWINLGSAQFELKNFDFAASALKKAVELNPNLMVSHLILGDALRMLGQWHDAFNSYQTAVGLERTPLSLNKLACALRSQGNYEFAEGLLKESITMDPSFTIARVNLATLQVPLERFEDAEAQLTEVSGLSLSPLEKVEIESVQLALSEHKRLKNAISQLTKNQNPAPLETALRKIPEHLQQVDEKLMETLHLYAELASTVDIDPVPIHPNLPAEWPQIEAMFMVPMVCNVNDYQQLKKDRKLGTEPSLQLLQSVNMVPAIEAARLCQSDLTDPTKAEVHLRHWHALAFNEVPGSMPGHFKYTQNINADVPTVLRVQPAFASATFRCFVSNIYNQLSPGYPRAITVLMALADLHLFADGNGRTAMTWLNRELEWAGLMPTIFSVQLGFKGDLGREERAARHKGGDLSQLALVLSQAQNDAKNFCTKLTQV